MKKPPFVRSPYNYDANQASLDGGLKCEDKTRTQQHFKDECDINILVDRYLVSGEMPQLQAPPIQGDFTNLPDMQTALNLVVKARESFMQLPAKARARFNNNAADFVDFCSHEENRDEMRRMGLWSPEAVQAFENDARAREDLIKEGKAAREAAKAATAAKGDTQKGVT